ncbi:unnamed protein product [Owenia fusiformis]|uniref:Uncharacterized protein n=1 Tax=Owenia fusiformis TaxID=6347 RepID=A0A8J1T6H9_OWEFU|nr:unnamed protein product [Owenia fusiformis]
MLNILPNSWMEHRPPERPFKAYPRSPISTQSSQSFYPNMQNPMTSPAVTASMTSMAAAIAMQQYQSHPQMAHHSQQEQPVCMVTKSEPPSPPRPSSLQMSGFIDISEGRNAPPPDGSGMPSSTGGSLDYSNSRNGDMINSRSSNIITSPMNYNRSNSSPAASNSGSAPSSSSEHPRGAEGGLDDLDNSSMPPKKRTQSVPDQMKDGAYWDKRKKNNESAKRSRDQRRMKEEQIAMRVVFLEQENLQLRTEVSLLKSEIEKLRCMLYNS